MALFSTEALNPGVRRREVFGWAMYDFANSGYTTVVLTAVFAAYFVGAVAGGAAWATFAWTLALSVSHAIVMVTMPAMAPGPTATVPKSGCCCSPPRAVCWPRPRWLSSGPGWWRWRCC
ncbi:hypothetical protein Y695_00835 [Hydrogenophaga sp. T4]|nr:hypothetical protein Y695_00835 [Hydrogenophaga sp. T4]